MKMIRYSSLLILLLVWSALSLAQRPHRTWATYVGDGYNFFNSVPPMGTVISDMVYNRGFIYITGTTTDTAYIASAGTHKPLSNHGDFAHTFIAKFDTSGQRVWGTYLGSDAPFTGDVAMFDNICWDSHISVDNNGNIFMGGTTTCDDGISTPGAFQPSRVGPVYSPNGFLVKFNNTGQLLWGTYFPDKVRGVACDQQGDVYITGGTYAGQGVASAGGFKPAITVALCDTFPTYDAFLVKFNSNGQRLWGTYYGATGNDIGYSVAVTGNNEVIMAGSTNSNTGIATPGTYQTSITPFGCALSPMNFITRFSASGQRLWGTYYGDSVTLSLGSRPLSILPVAEGTDFYIGGYTTPGKGFTTPGCFQPQFGGGWNDAYLARFSGTGQLIWGTFYGGAGEEYMQTSVTGDAFVSGMTNGRLSLSLTADNKVLMIGATTSQGMGATCAYTAMQPSISFMAKFSSTGMRQWGSYLDSRAGACAIAAGEGSKFYTGSATLDAGRATPNAWKTTKNNDEMAGLLSAFSDEYTCPTGTVTINNEGDTVLRAGGGFAGYQWFKNTNAIAGANGVTYQLSDTGSYYVVATDTCGCKYTSKVIRPDYQQPTSIATFRDLDVMLFPNPNQGHFTIRGHLLQANSAKALIEVSDITGRVVYHSEIKVANARFEQSFDLLNTAPGLYTVKIQSGNAAGVFKMVKH